MKKVFLSLAVVAVLTVVSCKKEAEAPAEGTLATETTEVVSKEDSIAAAKEDSIAAAAAAAAPEATEAPVESAAPETAPAKGK